MTLNAKPNTQLFLTEIFYNIYRNLKKARGSGSWFSEHMRYEQDTLHNIKENLDIYMQEECCGFVI